MTPLLDQIRQELGPMSSKAKARKLLKIMLEGVRERDEAMLDAGTAVLWPHAQHLMPGSTAVAVWGAMIDARLAQLTEEEVG